MKTIRIATRGSTLALWQANAVKTALEAIGSACEIITIKSSGDVNLTQPIYAMGISGVFTKELDVALLNNEADIAVHSLKDVPTLLPQGLVLSAVLERGAHQDIALIKNKIILEGSIDATIATSSLRRRAQWLAKFPNHKTIPIRGNVQTRLKKFHELQEMDAVIFAKAGLERLNLLPENAVVLDWMLPAPAQGIVGIVCRDGDAHIKEMCTQINHTETFFAATIERMFMNTLQAGCSVPVSGLALVDKQQIYFHGAVHDFDGSSFFEVKENFAVNEWQAAGKQYAEKLLQHTGASALVKKIRDKKWDDEAHIEH